MTLNAAPVSGSNIRRLVSLFDAKQIEEALGEAMRHDSHRSIVKVLLIKMKVDRYRRGMLTHPFHQFLDRLAELRTIVALEYQCRSSDERSFILLIVEPGPTQREALQSILVAPNHAGDYCGLSEVLQNKPEAPKTFHCYLDSLFCRFRLQQVLLERTLDGLGERNFGRFRCWVRLSVYIGRRHTERVVIACQTESSFSHRVILARRSIQERGVRMVRRTSAGSFCRLPETVRVGSARTSREFVVGFF